MRGGRGVRPRQGRPRPGGRVPGKRGLRRADGSAPPASIECAVETLSGQEMALRLGAAMALGLLIGLDRERKRRPAGMRTMMLVSLGAATFVIAGWEMLVQLAAEGVARAELSRVLQGIIGGIGFLGAGVILHQRTAVTGMTTAAAIWLTAAIGIACGLGLFKLALLTTAGGVVTLTLLKWVENMIFPDGPRYHPPEDARTEDNEKK